MNLRVQNNRYTRAKQHFNNVGLYTFNSAPSADCTDHKALYEIKPGREAATKINRGQQSGRTKYNQVVHRADGKAMYYIINPISRRLISNRRINKMVKVSEKQKKHNFSFWFVTSSLHLYVSNSIYFCFELHNRRHSAVTLITLLINSKLYQLIKDQIYLKLDANRIYATIATILQL